MKSLFAIIRNIAVSGFLFLLPVYVLLVIVTKAWASLSSVGTGLAKVFGLQSVLLVRVSFVDAFNKGDVDGRCVLFVPGAPDTSAGNVLLATRDQLRFLPAITANQLDASLKTMGKGLLDMAQERVTP